MSLFASSTVVFLFTDIEGSTRLWEADPERMRSVQAWHDHTLPALFRSCGGRVFNTAGDALCVAFTSASQAMKAAVQAQRLLLSIRDSSSPDAPCLPIRVRMAIHVGEVEERDGGYFGLTLSQTARILGAAHGGQTLVSATARTLAEALCEREIGFADLGTYRLRDIGSTRIFQLLHHDLTALFPPLNAPPAGADAKVHNLPRVLTSFIGRSETVETAVGALTGSDCRLLTLVGFGGMGKTRTAAAIAERCARELDFGVVWVSLASSRTADDMLTALYRALALPVQPHMPLAEQIWGHLRDRETLLVLDNTEQIADAGRVVSDLLQETDRTRFLVTSRRRLRLRTERCMEIAPLSPQESQQLFVDRARNLDPDFDIGAHGPDIFDLCSRLEGIPLIVELAAAQTIAMSPREIAQRIGRRLDLLRDEGSDLPERQQTLMAAIDWSYQLLSEPSRRRLAELSVFEGSFTADDAEEICGAENTLNALQEARSHSFLTTQTDISTRTTRFRMLEVVRLFAASNLDVQSTRTAASRHAHYVARRSTEQMIRFRSAEEEQALAELERMQPDLAAAEQWARTDGTSELQARLTLALHGWMYRRGLWHQALVRLRETLVALESDGQADSEVGAQLLVEIGGMDLDGGNESRAREHAERALRMAAENGYTVIQAEATNLLALAEMAAGVPEKAIALQEEALSLLGPGDHARRGMFLNNLGVARVALLEREQPDSHNAYRASLSYQQALEEMRLSGYARGEAEALQNLGSLAQRLGELAEARHRYAESLAIYRRLDYILGKACALYNLGETAEAEGDSPDAALGYLHAERLFLELGSPHSRAAADALRRLQAASGEEWIDWVGQAQRTTPDDAMDRLGMGR